MTERQPPLEFREGPVDVRRHHERRVRFEQDARSVRAWRRSGHVTYERGGVEVGRIRDDARDADVEVGKMVE